MSKLATHLINRPYRNCAADDHGHRDVMSTLTGKIKLLASSKQLLQLHPKKLKDFEPNDEAAKGM